MPDYEYEILPPPVKGLNTRDEEVLLDRLYSPSILNMIVAPSRIYKRLGYNQVGLNSMTGIGMGIKQFIDGTGTKHLVAITTTDFYVYDPNTDRWNSHNPSLVVEDCEDAWDVDAAASAAAVASPSKVGTNSVNVKIQADVADGDKLAYENIAEADYTNYSQLTFWIRSDTALTAGSVEIVLCTDADGVKANDYEEFVTNVDMIADQWYRMTVSGTFGAALADVESVAVYCNHATELDGDVTDVNIYLDDIIVQTVFTGDEDDYFSMNRSHDATAAGSPFPWQSASALLVANGTTDGVFAWDGTLSEDLASLSMGGTITAVSELIDHFDHLCFYDYEATTRFGLNVSWADLGDTENRSTGTSGEQFLTSARGSVMRALELQSDVILYSNSSITTQRYVGADAIFAFRTYISDIGLFAERALLNLGAYHIFVGSDQRIYRYFGATDLEPISHLIEEQLFNKINTTYLQHMIVGLDPGRQKLYVFIPDRDVAPADKYAQSYYALDLRQRTPVWEYGRFAHNVRGFAVLDNTFEYTCDSPFFAGRTCDEFPELRCDDAYFQSGYPLAVFLSYDEDNTVTKAYSLNQTSGKDDDQDIECHFSTGDVVLLEGTELLYFRAHQLTFNASAADSVSVSDSTVTVEYSIDYGVTWTELTDSPVTLASDWAEYVLELDVVTQRIRFRFSQDSDGDFQYRSGTLKLSRRTDRG